MYEIHACSRTPTPSQNNTNELTSKPPHPPIKTPPPPPPPTMPIQRPCLDCRRLTTNGNRCQTCQGKVQTLIDAHRAHKRNHYKGDYQARARAVREAATHCWICGETARPDDPWQADHVYPGDPESPLASAHRSCNIRRRFMTQA